MNHTGEGCKAASVIGDEREMRERMPRELISQLLVAFESPSVASEAQKKLSLAKSKGLRSDWEGSEKEFDFARLCVSIGKVLPAGGSVETGVLRGGTSALLVLTCPPESFHVSIDPYGLATQSYEGLGYKDWGVMRSTVRALAELADTCAVTYCHYLTDSMTFIAANLLQHPGAFRVVHLDGDHTYEAVRAELDYFTTRLSGPTVFILDDHDDNFPGVGRAVAEFPKLEPLIHRTYDFPPYGVCGFSGWFHSGGSREGVGAAERRP
jgi:hypothetical protein